MDPRIKLTVMLLVLLLLAYQLSITFWRFIPEPELFNQTTLISQSQGGLVEQDQQSNLAKADGIGRTYLFGKANVDTAPVQVVEEAPETKLNYKLRGIYYSEESTISSAIVEIQPNKSQYYRIGDELADKISVSAISSDHIIIDRYGKLERLNLQKPNKQWPSHTNWLLWFPKLLRACCLIPVRNQGRSKYRSKHRNLVEKTNLRLEYSWIWPKRQP